MDQLFQALVMGVVQGLTEFLPISSSGHLVLVPYLLGWSDPFIKSLAFSVVVSAGTLAALLVYFREDWLALIPAFFASLRDRSIGDDPDRRLAWLLVIATVPAALIALVLNDFIDRNTRTPGIVAILLVVGGAILWAADRWGPRTHTIERLATRGAAGIGLAGAGPVQRRLPIRHLHLGRPVRRPGPRGAARFSFLMATPITTLAVGYEHSSSSRAISRAPSPALIVGIVAAFVSGMLAIEVLLRYVRTRSYSVFVAYRLVLAAVVLAVFLTP
ncbi:MAG: undecaprenyl-diphosphate phosphatase [Chloroflexota bacterium]